MPNLATTPSASRSWHQAWNGSLRFRLLALGLLPMLVAFPFVMGVLVLVGGERFDSLLMSKLGAHLSSSRNYLEQLKADTRERVSQLVQSDRLLQLVNTETNRAELDLFLNTMTQSSGLSFLVVAKSDGSVVGASFGVERQSRLPDTYVVRQALVGVANAAYERFEAQQLAAFSPRLHSSAQIGSTPALLINAGAHFPLAVNHPDVILVGGILLNRNITLIEHLREIVFPVDALAEEAEGTAAIFVDGVNIALSRQRYKGQSEVLTEAPPGMLAKVRDRGQPWLGRAKLGQQMHIAGFAPLDDGNGHPIGMITVAFPDAPYQHSLWGMLAMVAGLLALTMLSLSLVFLRAGRGLTQRLNSMGATMTAVGNGDRAARVQPDRWRDEVGQLGQHFNALLDRVVAQDKAQRAAQQSLADEASRRRALFENERDGVAILNPDGSVFEANPKCAAMLGYSAHEMQRLNVSDWDTHFAHVTAQKMLLSVSDEGLFLETHQRRKDGSMYPAEVSVSRATWGDKSFYFLLQRDITDRKATEFELAQYQLQLENRVEQRTHELHDRSEQLNTIFALSPDGFVSFDRQLKVTFANLEFFRMTGLEANDIIGLDEQAFSQRLAGLCLASSPFPGLAALRSASKQHTDIHVAGTGRRQLIELAGPGARVLDVGIRMSDAQSVAQILYLRDVTHETEVDRMKSEFLSTAAHELRTPMASIFGYAELLLMQDFDQDDRQQFLTVIYRQSELMASIINELLDLARIEARRGKDFDMKRWVLQDVVTQTLTEFQPPDGRQAPNIVAPAEPIGVRVDRKKMQQVVLNIVSNAYKYSPKGSAVEVSFRTRTGDGAAQVGVVVRDHGIGMHPEQLARVCERFYRADTSGKVPGTGLGMSIVKEIVTLFGGELELASQPGKGTSVTVWLPAALQISAASDTQNPA